tara:strand:+ start:1101 stop:2501 length:1401 start_codon:yes stop_codon:yes gene_type:complete
MAQKRFLIDAGFETNADSKITGNLDMTNGTVLNVASPTLAHHVATKFYVDEAVTDLLGTAPDALNTLNELAAALGDDANFASTTATQLGLKASITYVDSEISAATPSFATLTGKPTTLAGYGITDSITSSDVTAQIDAATPSFSTLTGKPTTVAGYGITDGITATAVTTQVDAAQAAAISAAATDASTKADAALASAQTYADTAEADAVASAASDATTKADAAEADAVASAATDATTKANAAQSAAASDATTKANAAQSAASSDATTKANAAQAAAISAVTNGAGAAFDTLKEIQDAMATDAELSSAISSVTSSAASTASADATTKADAALAAAKVYADNGDANTTYTAGNGMTLSGTQFLMSGSYSGNFTATGDITAYSDDTLKTNVQLIDGALGRVQAIRGVTFDRISDGSTSTGVIAQELKAVLPEAVHTDANGVHSVAYGNITGLLIEAVKELSDQVNSLKK